MKHSINWLLDMVGAGRLVEITGYDLRSMAKAAYEMSSPKGLGFLHYRQGPADEDLVNSMVSSLEDYGSLDYVEGRCVKFNILKSEDGRIFTGSQWYDHTEEQQKALLAAGKREAVDILILPPEVTP